jgi:hypothetical protein
MKNYKALLKRLRPKIIVETVYYTMDSMIINEIAQQRGIVSIELQHGRIGKSHLAYNFTEKGSYTFFPQKLFVFAAYWKTNARYPIEANDILDTGYIYFEKQRAQYQTEETTIARHKNILFLSQPNWNGAFADVALEAAKKLTPQGWHILFKLHPQEVANWEQRYPQLVGGAVEVVGTQKPLYQLFAESLVQVGVFSTSIYEGLGFSLRTFIYDLPGAKTMEDLCQKGYALKINNVQALYDSLTNTLTQPSIHPKEIAELFWKSKALTNVTAQIDRFLQTVAVIPEHKDD